MFTLKTLDSTFIHYVSFVLKILSITILSLAIQKRARNLLQNKLTWCAVCDYMSIMSLSSINDCVRRPFRVWLIDFRLVDEYYWCARLQNTCFRSFWGYSVLFILRWNISICKEMRLANAVRLIKRECAHRANTQSEVAYSVEGDE